MGDSQSKPQNCQPKYENPIHHPRQPQQQMPQRVSYEDMRLDEFGLSRHIPRLVERLDEEYLIALYFYAEKTYEGIMANEKFKEIYRRLFDATGNISDPRLQQLRNYICCLEMEVRELREDLPKALRALFSHRPDQITAESILTEMRKFLLQKSRQHTKEYIEALTAYQQNIPSSVHLYENMVQGFFKEMLGREAIKQYIFAALKLHLKDLGKRLYESYQKLDEQPQGPNSELNILLKKGEAYDRLPQEFEAILRKLT